VTGRTVDDVFTTVLGLLDAAVFVGAAFFARAAVFAGAATDRAGRVARLAVVFLEVVT